MHSTLKEGVAISSRAFEYIAAIEKYHNISKAAEALYISQPTLSKFLSSYERQLGLKLFERCGNRYYLTYAGERYIHYARQILAIETDLHTELAEISLHARGRLAIGYQLNRSSYMVPMTIPAFHTLYPNVEISLQESSSKQLEQMLLDGLVDLVIYNFVPRHPALQYEILSQEEVLLIVSDQNPLARFGQDDPALRYPFIDLQRFKNEPFILQKEDQTTGQMARQILAAENIHPPIVLETRSIIGSIRLVEQNIGSSFVVETHLAHNVSNDRIRCFSISRPNKEVDLVVARRRGSYLNQYAAAYIKIVSVFLDRK